MGDGDKMRFSKALPHDWEYRETNMAGNAAEFRTSGHCDPVEKNWHCRACGKAIFINSDRYPADGVCPVMFNLIAGEPN